MSYGYAAGSPLLVVNLRSIRVLLETAQQTYSGDFVNSQSVSQCRYKRLVNNAGICRAGFNCYRTFRTATTARTAEAGREEFTRLSIKDSPSPGVGSKWRNMLVGAGYYTAYCTYLGNPCGEEQLFPKMFATEINQLLMQCRSLGRQNEPCGERGRAVRQVCIASSKCNQRPTTAFKPTPAWLAGMDDVRLVYPSTPSVQ
ncbi:uncharacterized protein RAG0_09433 [Rhynchosporium agropyri]|uniref:Uncharacterized protein n=1 Tax=Rhynchosporium agropyri TaxID=914238 RepID=A0A1E1KVG6_9HELO|nr:uncharacterized protein RAG0_09433 [Rhynchosporium agropyri]